MYGTRSIRANCREEILGFQTMGHVIKLFSIASEENRTRPRAIAHANYIALYVFWSVGCRCKRLIVPSLATRGVRY